MVIQHVMKDIHIGQVGINMKFLLLALSLNLQILYPDLDTCETAVAEIESAGHEAICIPKGEDYRHLKDEDEIEMIFSKFEGLVRTFKRIERDINR